MSPGPSGAGYHARSDLSRIVGGIGIVLLAGTPALATDVPGMSCSEIGSFAREVAEQKAEGRTVDAALRRLRQSLVSEHADTERALEKIIRAIYGTPIFSTATPEEVGTAYQDACEGG